MTFSPEPEKSNKKFKEEDDLAPPTTSSFTVTRKNADAMKTIDNHNNTLTTGNLRASLESLHKLN